MPASELTDRRAAYAFARSDGYRPDTIHIAYSKRLLGGLFSVNTIFTDHPVGTRLSGEYPVVTVRSILRYLQERGYRVRLGTFCAYRLTPRNVLLLAERE